MRERVRWRDTRAEQGRRWAATAPMMRVPDLVAQRRFRSSCIARFLRVELRTKVAVPVMVSKVAAGFPSPADDYMEGTLDFNELLISNPEATLVVHVVGESMAGAGIFPGDVAVIDRAETPVNGSIVVAIVDSDFTLKRFVRKNGCVVLQAENKKFQDIVFTEGMECEVWGVVTYILRKLRP